MDQDDDTLPKGWIVVLPKMLIIFGNIKIIRIHMTFTYISSHKWVKQWSVEIRLFLSTSLAFVLGHASPSGSFPDNVYLTSYWQTKQDLKCSW